MVCSSAYPDQLAHAGDDVHCIVRGRLASARQGRPGYRRRRLGPPARLPGPCSGGKGMLDGCAVGGVFASPSADQMLEVTMHRRRQGRGLHLRQLWRRRHEL